MTQPNGKPDRKRLERFGAMAAEWKRRQARKAQEGEGGLLEFVRYFWHVLEPETPLVEGWPLDALCEHLEAVTRGRINRLLANVSPGSTKSLVTDVFWPAWEWGPMNMPHLRYVTFSYSAMLTERDNGRFRDLIISKEYQDLWSHRFKVRKVGETRVTNDKHGWKLASSVGGVGTGERGDRVVLDDPHNVKESESQTVRDETVRWFRESMSNRLNDPERSAIVIIMQRLHETDVSGVIISEDFDYCHLMIPMEFEPGREASEGNQIGWRDPRGFDEDGYELVGDELEAAAGSLAWPERFPAHVVEGIKHDIGIYAYVGQYQQRPEPRGGGIFKRDWWQEYTPKDGKTFPQFDYVCASLDGAFTANEQNDPSALTVWGTFSTPGRRRGIMLCHAWRKFLEMHGPKVEREGDEILRPGMSPKEVSRRNAMFKERASEFWGLVEWTVDTCRRFRVNVLLIEAKASGITVSQEIRRLYKNEDFSVILVTPVGDKVARAHAVVHVWSQGLVYAPERDWADMVKDEMATFPRGRFKDLTDSATQGMKHLRDLGLAQRPDELAVEEYEAAQIYHEPEPLYPA